MRANILQPGEGIIGSCKVLDLSTVGARLELDSEFEVPSPLWLKIQDDPTIRYCTLKWARDGELGVEFSLERLIMQTEEEAELLRREMSWGNQERRSGRDRRTDTRG